MVRYSSLVRLSHPLLHTGLSRRILDHLIRPSLVYAISNSLVGLSILFSVLLTLYCVPKKFFFSLPKLRSNRICEGITSRIELTKEKLSSH